MHKITTIGEHSICMDLLPPKPNILDAGCRGFDITRYFGVNEPPVNVINVDIADLPARTKIQIEPVYKHKSVWTNKAYANYTYYNLGISNYNGLGEIKLNAIDPQATELLPSRSPEIPVFVYTTEKLKHLLNIEWWDYIKLDVEGEEYQILDTNLHPMATQVSVEFHEHTHRAIGKENLDNLLDKLSRWYHIYNRNWESRHCAGFNYWDILLIAKF